MKLIKTTTYLTLPLLALSLAAAPAIAGNGNGNGNGNGKHIDKARVINSQPVYVRQQYQEPHQECWMETVEIPASHNRRSNESYTPTILGSLIGGAIGNAVGHNKSNKKVGAVAGALLGAAVGNDISRQNRQPEYTNGSQFREEQRCETRYLTTTREELIGYDVTYKYLGQTYSTRTRQDPGSFLRVAVDVRPLEF